MDSLSIITFITHSAHLIGFIGCVICLLFFYVQLMCLFIPGIGVWNGFRLSRLLGLAQRFLWLLWLTGISLLISQHTSGEISFRNPILASKLLILLTLSISTIGLDGIVRRLFYSVEGARKLFVTHREAHFLKFSLAMSFASWGAMIFVAYCYFVGAYSHGMLVITSITLFSLTLALMLPVNDRWINNMTSRETVNEMKK